MEIRTSNDIESDEFNDLIVIERKILDLYADGIVSEDEIYLLKYLEDGKPLVNSKENFGKNRISLAKNFDRLCEKIAFYVGDYFTDDGYVDYMKIKYNLADSDVERMLDYMKSKYKNKLIRKPKKSHEPI